MRLAPNTVALQRGCSIGGIRCEMPRQPPDGSLAYYWRRASNRTFFIVNPDGDNPAATS